ncbi:hypothetical protein E3U43_002377, partial [Larimichthys crocea]
AALCHLVCPEKCPHSLVNTLFVIAWMQDKKGKKQPQQPLETDQKSHSQNIFVPAG